LRPAYSNQIAHLPSLNKNKKPRRQIRNVEMTKLRKTTLMRTFVLGGLNLEEVGVKTLDAIWDIQRLSMLCKASCKTIFSAVLTFMSLEMIMAC
jgi:hypothetical protein